jgi:type I restriction-modification system DNA methylase subunit
LYSVEEARKQIQRKIDQFTALGNDAHKLTEEETKKDYILPLFNALNWRTDDSKEVSAEERISKKRVDYGFRLSGIPKFFLEAKQAKEKLDADDAKQAMNYSYLRSTTWAILTNFVELKVYNAEWKSQNIFEKLFFELKYDEYINKFDKLWLLSKDSFHSDELDRTAEEWGKKQKKLPVTPVTERLFEDLVKWRQGLTTDLTSRRPNMEILKTDENLDESVQRIIDRLIFMKVTEDRRLEPVTLQARLREWKVTRRGKPFYRLLVELFSEFDTNYNSELFAHHMVDELEISDLLLNRMIEQLYESKDGFEYDFSAIDADVLGSIYEQYLGYMLEKGKSKATLVESYEQRKKMGIYYTPTYVVDFIVRGTVGRALETTRESMPRILDPACGSGSFLLRALTTLIDLGKVDSFAKKMITLDRSIYGVDLDPRAVEIAQVNLLLRVLETQRTILPTLDRNIRRGNSIVDDPAVAGKNAFDWSREFPSGSQGPFDFVIGNPPYVAWSEIEPRKQLEGGKFLDLSFRCRPNHKDAQPNLYLFFLIRGLSLCKKQLSFILPTEWLGAKYAMDFRDYIIRHCSKITIYKFDPEYKVFKTHGTVGTNSMILVLDKTDGPGIVEQYHITAKSEAQVKRVLVDDSYLEKMSTYTSLPSKKLSGKDWNLLNVPTEDVPKIKVNHVTLDDKRFFKVVGGFQPPIDRIPEFELDEQEYQNLPKGERKIVFPAVVEAHSIKRYKIEDEGRFWIIANGLDLETLKSDYPNLAKILNRRIVNKKGEWWKFPNIRNIKLFVNYPTKLLSPRTANQNSFALDTRGTLFKGTNTAVISTKLDPSFVLGILNSGFASRWYSERGTEYHGGEAKKYEPDKVRRSGIPIPIVAKDQQTYLSSLVSRLMKLMRELEKENVLSEAGKRIVEAISGVEKEIDEWVSKTLGLSLN